MNEFLTLRFLFPVAIMLSIRFLFFLHFRINVIDLSHKFCYSSANRNEWTKKRHYTIRWKLVLFAFDTNPFDDYLLLFFDVQSKAGIFPKCMHFDRLKVKCIAAYTGYRNFCHENRFFDKRLFNNLWRCSHEFHIFFYSIIYLFWVRSCRLQIPIKLQSNFARNVFRGIKRSITELILYPTIYIQISIHSFFFFTCRNGTLPIHWIELAYFRMHFIIDKAKNHLNYSQRNSKWKQWNQ